MNPDDHPRSAPRPRSVFQFHDYKCYLQSRFLAVLGWQMQSLAVSWQIYALTHNKLHLGYIGLVQFLPNFAFALVTGHTADRFDRREIIRVCQAILILCSLALGALTLHGISQVGWVFLLLFLIGTAFAFLSPASQAMIPLLVPTEHYANAVTWNSSIWQLATILGPSLGGLVYWLSEHFLGELYGAAPVYFAGAALMIAALVQVSRVRVRSGRMESAETSVRTLLAGIHYVFDQKVILGCISLDLFAVLLGGATALLPVYARDILHVGTWGQGLLRSAPSVGALLMALLVTHLPPMRRAGATMLWCVAGFGLCTIIFGVSHSFIISLISLTLLGGFDMVSVIVRHTLVQLLTPKSMLGRVSAVNMVFIGASNELGEFESGVTAAWWGAPMAVVIGGLGTLFVVGLWARIFPAMRQIGRLEHPEHPHVENAATIETPAQ